MIKGAIFDVDGTLVDSLFVWEIIGEAYIRSIGYEPKEKLSETFKTFSLHQAAHYYQSEYGVTLPTDEIINGINELLKKYYNENVSLKKGAAEFLECLYQNGVTMCIATANHRDLVEAILRRCHIHQYFAQIFTCSSVGSGKDTPIIYREALKYLGTDKSQTVVFEDAVYALKTAKRDGFITVGVSDDDYEANREEIITFSDYYSTDYSDIQKFWKFASAL